MTANQKEQNRRILIIDDQETIHEDFRKTLTSTGPDDSGFAMAKAALFGEPSATASATVEKPDFELDFAFQGQQGLELFKKASAEGRPYAVAFVDMRMPPGWDGLETIARLWAERDDLEVVICTAYSEYSWEEVVQRLGNSDRLLILKKPFDTIEVVQLANALTQKWDVTRQARLKLEDISHMVTERTRDLEKARDELLALNSELVSAYQTAEAANRSKGEFLANVSHEIRTPMTAICGYVELIQDSCPPSSEFCDHTLPEYLAIIVRNAHHLRQLIDDLLDLSKIEAGKIEIEKRSCSPLSILDDIHSLMVVEASKKGLPFAIHFDGAIPETVQTDSFRLRQVLLNLVSNAIKFTDKGEIRLIARLAGTSVEPSLQFDVVDTGIGLAKDQVARLFHPFTQADASVNRRYGGTGMGLALSRRLAELLGGTLTVQSELGVGSTFRLDIAVGSLDGVTMIRDAAQVDRTASKVKTPLPAVSLDCHVLLAEDGLDNQRLIKRILEIAGARVQVVQNGQEAVNEALTAQSIGRSFDVILMDMQMPLLDGYAATRQLRERGYQGSIIALTAHAMTTAREECMKAGCNDYATKPIERPTLLTTVKKWAGGRTAKSETSQAVVGQSP